MANERERRKRERLSARETAEKQAAGWESTLFRLPPECKAFEVKQACVKRIDVIPFIAGKGNPYREPGLPHYERTFYAHIGVGMDNKRYVCPAKTARRPCPICEYRRDLAINSEGDDEVKELMKKLTPKRRQLWALYDLDHFDEGLFLWEISFHNFGRLVNDAIKASDIDDEYEFFSDLEDGLTIKIAFEEGHYAGKTFFQPSRVDFKRRKDNYDGDLINEIPCLDDLLIIEPYEKLKEEMYQTPSDGDEDTDDEEAPEPRRSSNKTKPQPNRKKDEDEEEEPARSVKRPNKPRRPVDDDEPEDDEPEDDSEDDVCVACEGTGKNTRGRTCRVCKGRGRVEEADDDDEDEEPVLSTKRRTDKPRRPAKEEEPEDDEEEEAPVSAKTKKRSSVDIDEDDDDDDDWKNWDK